jgi:hypothetical protein
MESLVKRDLEQLNGSLENLRNESGVEILKMTEDMLEKCAGLSHLGLQPFDQAILASILVKAEMLKKDGVDRFAFCEADSDLQPWDKLGATKEPLASLSRKSLTRPAEGKRDFPKLERHNTTCFETGSCFAHLNPD